MVRGVLSEADLTSWLLAGSSGARPGPPSVRIRDVVQHAAIRRRQSARAARCVRREPKRRHGLRGRYVYDRAGIDRLLRRPLRAIRLPRAPHAHQPARRVDGIADRSLPRDDGRLTPDALAPGPRNSCRLPIRGSGCHHSARSRRSNGAKCWMRRARCTSRWPRARHRDVDALGRCVPAARGRSARDVIRRRCAGAAWRQAWPLPDHQRR